MSHVSHKCPLNHISWIIAPAATYWLAGAFRFGPRLDPAPLLHPPLSSERRDTLEGHMVARLRGRRGVEQRKRRLEAEPLCRDCKSAGLVRASTVPDHITPLSKGGLDIDDNIRCLCADCHRLRTVEQFGFKRKQAIGDDGWPTSKHN